MRVESRNTVWVSGGSPVLAGTPLHALFFRLFAQAIWERRRRFLHDVERVLG